MTNNTVPTALTIIHADPTVASAAFANTPPTPHPLTRRTVRNRTFLGAAYISDMTNNTVPTCPSPIHAITWLRRIPTAELNASAVACPKRNHLPQRILRDPSLDSTARRICLLGVSRQFVMVAPTVRSKCRVLAEMPSKAVAPIRPLGHVAACSNLATLKAKQQQLLRCPALPHRDSDGVRSVERLVAAHRVMRAVVRPQS